MLRGRDYPHNAGAALYSILYRNSLCNGHYSAPACPRVHCRALQLYSTLQHTTALQLYSVYTLQHSAPPLTQGPSFSHPKAAHTVNGCAS